MRIDRDDAIAGPLQVTSDPMAGAAGIGAETHDRNRPGRREDLRYDISRRRGPRPKPTMARGPPRPPLPPAPPAPRHAPRPAAPRLEESPLNTHRPPGGCA